MLDILAGAPFTDMLPFDSEYPGLSSTNTDVPMFRVPPLTEKSVWYLDGATTDDPYTDGLEVAALLMMFRTDSAPISKYVLVFTVFAFWP